MRKIAILALVCLLLTSFCSCTSYRHAMREPNALLELKADDFELSEPFTGEATVTKVLNIDWERTFGTTRSGYVGGLPIIGPLQTGGANYALYDLLQKHPGYDVIFYPQVEVYREAPILGTNIFSITHYKVTARLGKLKNK